MIYGYFGYLLIASVFIMITWAAGQTHTRN